MAKPKHYQLFNDEVIKFYSELKASEIGVYLYLASKHPFEDSKIEIDTSLIAEHLGFHRRTVQLAVNKLAKLKYIEVDLVRFKYRIAKHGCNSKVTPICSQNEIRESEDRQSDLRIAVSESEDRQSDLRIAVSESEDRQQLLEPSNPSTSQTQQTLQTLKTLKTLSDPYGEESPLTAESTEEIGSEEREKKKLTEEEEEKISAKTQERSHPYSELANKKVVESLAGNENPNPKTEFARNSENETASKEESQPSKATSQPQQSESSTTELGQKLSSSPENAANSRPKPKSSSSRGKGFGGRSINEILNPHTRIPRARRELREFYSFGKEDCDEFEKFAESKAKKYREEVVILDSWVLSMLESMVAEYRVWKQKKDYAQRVRASYVAQEQKIESEPEQIEESDPQKPQRSMKEIAAEIRRKRDEELAKKQQNKGKR